MIDAQDLIQEPNTTEVFKLGVVVELFSNKTAKITFDGEDSASQKQYSYLNNYIPVVGDRVMMAAISGTFIILGKVNYNVSPGGTSTGDFTSLSTTGNVTVGADLKVSGKLGFFGAAPATKYSVSDPQVIQTSETADATYSSNEVTMLNHLKTDVINLRTELIEILRCLERYNLA